MSPWASLRELRPARLPRGRRAGGRRGDSRWELTPSAAGMRELTVKLHQQYETPAAVMDFVRREWRPTFDAMATPFSAICGAYGRDDTVHGATPSARGMRLEVIVVARRKYHHHETGPPHAARAVRVLLPKMRHRRSMVPFPRGSFGAHEC